MGAKPSGTLENNLCVVTCRRRDMRWSKDGVGWGRVLVGWGGVDGCDS